MKSLSFILFVMLSLPTWASGTIVESRVGQLLKLNALEKITVGPDDNYQPDVSSDGQSIIFTRKTNLSQRLFMQNLNDHTERELLNNKSDSQSPQLSPDQKRVLFISYLNDSLGDLCILKLRENTVEKCLGFKGEVTSPIWLDDDNVVFIKRDGLADNDHLVKFGLKNNETVVLDSGQIWSPSLSKDKELVLYSAREASRRVLKLKSLTKKYEKIISIDLPGFPSYPSFSENGEFIYFAQFFGDSNRDQLIDASDNSVIFRIKTSDVFGKARDMNPDKKRFVLPEQITSLEQNCNFPLARSKSVYLTCAHEGSLDIYRLPEEGVVPQQWTKQIVLESRKSARTYGQRILLDNIAFVRFHEGEGSEEKLYKKNLVNFLMSGEAIASLFYLNYLEFPEKEAIKEYLTVKNSIEKKTDLQKSSEIQNELNASLKKISRLKSHFGLVLQGLVHQLKRDFHSAEKALQQSQREFNGFKDLEDIFYWQLLKANVLHNKSQLKASANLGPFKPLLTDSHLSQQARIFYFNDLLEIIDAKLMIVIRPWLLNDKNLLELYDSEEVVQKIVHEKNEKEKDRLYQDLDKIMSRTRDNYFLKRALYVRAISVLTEADEFKYLNYVATTWLKYTRPKDPEFFYARQTLIDKVLGRAYLSLNDGKPNYASNHFYSSLSLTDDLESHWGYIYAMDPVKNSAALDKSYDYLQKKQFTNENMNYVESLITLLKSKDQDLTESQLLQMNKKLEKLSDLFYSPTYNIFVGYLYMRRLQLSVNSFEFNTDLSQMAHQHLMLAYDLASDQPRLRAAALSNLGLLHFLISDCGLSSRFFEQRLNYGFSDVSEKNKNIWFAARANYYLGDQEKALELLNKVDESALDKKQGEYTEIVHLRALLELDRGQYLQSEKLFEKLLAMYNSQNKSSYLQAKILTGLAFSQLKNKKNTDAKHNFSKVIEVCKSLSVESPNAAEKIADDPRRLEYISYGFLAQLSSGHERTEFLKQKQARINSLLDKDIAEIEDIKIDLQLADAESTESHLSQGITKTLFLGEKTKGFHFGLYSALKSELELFLKARFKNAKLLEQLHGGVAHFIAEVQKQGLKDPTIELNIYNLKAYRYLSEKNLLAEKTSGKTTDKKEELLSGALASRIKSVFPLEYTQLKELLLAY